MSHGTTWTTSRLRLSHTGQHQNPCLTNQDNQDNLHTCIREVGRHTPWGMFRNPLSRSVRLSQAGVPAAVVAGFLPERVAVSGTTRAGIGTTSDVADHLCAARSPGQQMWSGEASSD